MKLLFKTRTFLSFAAAFCAALLLMSVRCFAYDYSKITGTSASGANITGYETALQVNVVEFGADPEGKKDSSKAMQKALDFAIDNASDTVQVKVYVPDGIYIIDSALKIYSNTWLYLEDGATIYRNFDAGRMLCNARQTTPGGYEGERNIIIEGGCLDGNTTGTIAYSNLRFAHMTNLWIKNVDIRNNYNGHHLEIGGAKNVTIENCTFQGYRGSAEKEAIQLDVMNSPSVFVGYEPFDDTPCENVVIKNNKFVNLMRGLGSHSATVGVYYRNILIQGNTFENLTSTAMVMYNYKNCIVENNTMKNVGYGIDFSYMNENAESSFLVPVQGYSGINDRLDDNANTIIRNNNISTAKTNYVSSPWAIRLMGRQLTDNAYHPDYNYKVSGVKITGNTLRCVGTAVSLNDTSGILINSNTIVGNNIGLEKDLISINGSSECTVSSNLVKKAVANCVYISGGKNNVITSNKLYNAGVSGVYVSGEADELEISSNRIQDSGSNGIKITKNSNANVSKNICKNSANSGILFDTSSGSVTYNNCKENSADGIMSKDSQISCRSNKLTSNGKYGLDINEGSVVNIGSNNYSGNTNGDMRIVDGGQAKINGPANLSCDDVYDDNAQLSWNAVDEADGYIVYRKISDSDNEYEEIARVTASSYVDTKLASKTKYDYIVRGYFEYDDDDMIGQNSATVTIKTKTSLSDASSDLDTVVNFTGKKRTQVFNVFVDGVALAPEIDYTVKYSNNLNAGTAYVTVTGKGEYCKAKVFTFDIVFMAGDVSGVKQTEAVDKTPILMQYDLYKTSYEYRLTYDNAITDITQAQGTTNNYFENALSQAGKYNGIKLQFRSVRSSVDRTVNGAWI